MRRRWKIGLAAIVTLVVIVGGLGWWLGYFSTEPEAATVEAAIAAIAAEDEEATTASSAAPSPEPTPESTPDIISDLTGTWTVEQGEATFVGYRVQEVLRGLGDFTAVGRTPLVSGSLVAESDSIRSVEIVADLTGLESDNAGRDRQMERQGLETDSFPDATFQLTSPIPVGQLPAGGETVGFVAVGDLTIHGVTNPVEIAVEGAVQSGRVIVVGAVDVVLADYGITPPSAPIVAAVEDRGIMELSLVFTRL